MASQKLQVSRAKSVTPSDTLEIPNISGGEKNHGCVLYIGIGGSVKVKTSGGDEVTYLNVPSSSFIPVSVVKVFATGTSASGIIAHW